MKAFKGFNKDLTCRGFQYEEGKEFHTEKAKGCLGAHLILSDWRYIGEKWSDGDYKTPYDVESWELAGAKMVQVDGEKIKADTYYRCVDGEVVEADE